LDWFYETSGNRGFTTGERLDWGAAAGTDAVITPRGEKIDLKAGRLDPEASSFQGIYQLNHNRDRQWIAVNFTDTRESDLRDAAPIDLRNSPGAASSASTLFSLWPYLLVASFLLLILEWFISPRLALRREGRVSRPAFSHP